MPSVCRRLTAAGWGYARVVIGGDPVEPMASVAWLSQVHAVDRAQVSLQPTQDFTLQTQHQFTAAL